MSESSFNQQERREERRRRRIRNQILAYFTLVMVIAVIAFGIVFAVQYLKKVAENANAAKEQQQSKVEEVLSSEGEIQPPQPEEEEPPVVELTPQQKLDEIANACIEVMPIEDKVAGLFFVTPEAITGVSTAVKAGDGTREALSKYAVGGIVYDKKNMIDEAQFAEMVDNTKLYSKYPVFLAVDEEGGAFSPLAAAGLAEGVGDAKTIGETGDVNVAFETGTAMGTYMAKYGLNMNIGLVADLAVVENSIMDKRAYGSDADAVAPFVNAMQSALKAQGIHSCIGSFPGMGSLTTDPKDGVAVMERTKEELQAQDIRVFQSAIENGADMIMVTNGAASDFTGDNTPCSLSKEVVTEYLRNTLGYDGVILSGPMDLKAISEYHTAEDAAVMALKAGCDMIYLPEDFEQAYNGVLKAVEDGTISQERINDALRRIYRIKYADRIEQ